MVTPPFLVVKGSFQGMAGLLSFALIQRPGLAQQIKKGKISPSLSGTFWRLNVATHQLAGVKN